MIKSAERLKQGGFPENNVTIPLVTYASGLVTLGFKDSCQSSAVIGAMSLAALPRPSEEPGYKSAYKTSSVH